MKTFKQYILESVEFVGWNEANDIIVDGTTIEVRPHGQDVSWKMKRTGGKQHADVEPLTSKDTKLMVSVVGSGTTFETADYAPVVVTYKGREFAAALMNVPHAGSNTSPPGKITPKLSGGFTNMVNGDYIKDNNVTGHFCLHFEGSTRHTDNAVDDKAQHAINQMQENP